MEQSSKFSHAVNDGVHFSGFFDVLTDIVYASYKLVRSSLSKKVQQEMADELIHFKQEE